MNKFIVFRIVWYMWIVKVNAGFYWLQIFFFTCLSQLFLSSKPLICHFFFVIFIFFHPKEPLHFTFHSSYVYFKTFQGKDINSTANYISDCTFKTKTFASLPLISHPFPLYSIGPCCLANY